MASDAGPYFTFRGGGTLTAGVPSGISNPGPLIAFAGTGSFDADLYRDPGSDTEWTARLVDKDGNLLALLPNAVWGPISSVHNEPVTVSGVTVPASDPNLSTLLTDNESHELQLWWGSHMVFFGPISRPRYQNGTFTFDAADALEYFKRRVVGDEETNELADPDFALYPWLGGYSSWGGWYVKKVNQSGSGFGTVDYTEYKTVSAPIMAESVRSLQLYNNDNDGTSFLEFLQSGNITANSFDLQVVFVAYAYLGAAPTHTAEQGHGMALGMYTGSLADFQGAVRAIPLGMQSDAGVWEQTSTAAIDPADFPRQEWVRLETSVTVPAGETRLVVAEIACPDGETVTIAQHPRVVTSEGIEFKNDIARVIDGLADHAQDTTFGKSDLNIGVGVATAPNVGISVDRVYPYAEHRNIWQAMSEFTSETVDIWVQELPTSRSLHVGYPRGTYKRQLRLEVRPNGGNCELLSWTGDTERASNRLFHMGAGSGIGRDVGYAKDASAHGGVTLESVDYSDPLLLTGDLALTARAEDRLESLTEPELLVLRTFPGEGLWRFIKYVSPGDWLPVRVYVLAADDSTPIFDIAADYRVVSKTLDSNDVVTFNLNRRDVPDALL